MENTMKTLQMLPTISSFMLLTYSLFASLTSVARQPHEKIFPALRIMNVFLI